jgi:transcriptional regulator with XRE-family HTH domain
VDVCSLIRQRLTELGLEQKDLAAAAEVTDSYMSQLLTRKKLPPAPARTDIYEKMAKLLKLPSRDELIRTLGAPPTPLNQEVRALILRKCAPANEKQIRAIFEKEPFGALERLVTQKLLDVVNRVAKEELESEDWLHRVAQLSGRSYANMRVIMLEFLDTDVFNVSVEHCVSFLDPLIEFWDIDLASFDMEIVLDRRLVTEHSKRLRFVERESDEPFEDEPGLKEFLRDPSLSGDVAEKEIEFLKKLRFNGKHPTALYYYRELQNLRDPLHFRGPAPGNRIREG